MNIKDSIHYKKLLRRANPSFHFKNSNMFRGEYISDAEEAEQYILWLKNKSGYENYEIISALEHQIRLTPCEFSRMILEMELNTMNVGCSFCGKELMYEQMHQVEDKTPMHSSERTIARSLTGATMAKEVTTTYSVNHFLLCPHCYKKYILRKVLKWVLITLLILGIGAFLLL